MAPVTAWRGARTSELTSVWDKPAYAVRSQLLALWDRYKACRGDGCRVPVPQSLWTTLAWLDGQYRDARARERACYDR